MVLMNHLWGKNRDLNVENRLVNTKKKKEGEQTERVALTLYPSVTPSVSASSLHSQTS